MPRFSSEVIAPAFLGAAMPGNPFGVAFFVSNTTNPTEDQGSPGTTRQGRSVKNPFTTIARAVSEAVSGRGDTIVIQRGTYAEDVTFNKAGLTVVGAVPFGYPDHVVLRGKTVVSVSGVSFYNMEFFSNDATFPSVRIGSFADSASTVVSEWFENCSFASDGTTEPEAGVLIFGGNDLVFRRCWFIDNTFGANIHSTAAEFPGHVVFDGCEFSETTTAHISDAIGNFDSSLSVTARSGVGINFLARDCDFNAGAVTPTDHINISSNGTSNGLITACRFADATGDVGDIVIPAGILYAANASEAGWSAARPA